LYFLDVSELLKKFK